MKFFDNSGLCSNPSDFSDMCWSQETDLDQLWNPLDTSDKQTIKVMQKNDDSGISSSLDIQKYEAKSEFELEDSVRKLRETNKNALWRCREAKKKQVQDLDMELKLLSKRNNILHETLLHK